LELPTVSVIPDAIVTDEELPLVLSAPMADAIKHSNITPAVLDRVIPIVEAAKAVVAVDSLPPLIVTSFAVSTPVLVMLVPISVIVLLPILVSLNVTRTIVVTPKLGAIIAILPVAPVTEPIVALALRAMFGV
jgi:hypothetical protein